MSGDAADVPSQRHTLLGWHRSAVPLLLLGLCWHCLPVPCHGQDANTAAAAQASAGSSPASAEAAALPLSSSSSSAAAAAAATAAATGTWTCAAGCYAKGNCNIDERRCECPLGFGGEECEVQHLSACQLTADSLPFWGLFLPKNCLCYQQAAYFFNCSKELGGPAVQDDCLLAAYQYKLLTARCFWYLDLPASQQRSAVPELGDARVSWHKLRPDWQLSDVLSEAEGRKAVDLWGNAHCVAVPHSECPDSCSLRGACVKDCRPSSSAPECSCYKGFSGNNCATVDERLCPNGCSGRGSCVGGFCHCQRPWFGLDCSRSHAPEPRPDHVPARHRLVVYMYELPHSLASPAVGLDDNVHDSVPIYSAYSHFLDAFLPDWSVRTEDPWEANLFYVPSFTYCYSSNNGDLAPHLRRVLGYISERWPFWNRTGGKDHFIWFTGDQGSCRLPPEATSMIQLVHFGYHKNIRLQGPSINGVKPYDPVHGCYQPARDIVAAPYSNLGIEAASETYARLLRDQGRDPSRKHLFFFAGGVRSDKHHYSGGVRQAIHAMLQQLRNNTHNTRNTLRNIRTSTDSDASLADANLLSDIVYIEGHTEKYAELYSTSKFCLAPHGSGFGIRLSIAMVHGCIPVIIQDYVYQPYEDLIPYEDLSVRIAKRHIPDLIPILRAITEDEQASMRLAMARHYRAFIWEPHAGGQAYNYTITALHRRLHALWGELYR